LFGILSIPVDTFYSLFPCLASNHFKEIELRLLRMHYRQGDLDEIRFSPKETPMEDLVEQVCTTKKRHTCEEQNVPYQISPETV
jgi:hypothetical protein